MTMFKSEHGEAASASLSVSFSSGCWARKTPSFWRPAVRFHGCLMDDLPSARVSLGLVPRLANSPHENLFTHKKYLVFLSFIFL